MKNNLNKALSYCSKNIRCRSEVINKLKSWNLDIDEERNLIEFLELHNFFFTDEEYLNKFLANLSSVKGYSKIQLKQKLVRKGIPLKIIDLKLNEYFKDNEEVELNKYLKRNARKLQSKPREVLIKHLLSKGFKYNLILNQLKINNL